MTAQPAATHPSHQPSVLIAGASFAGLASAWWMHRLGYAVTVVEIAGTLRKGGTPVDIREGVIDVVRRMGLFDRIRARSLPPRPVQFLDGHGRPIGAAAWSPADAPAEEPEYEIERDDLLDLLFDEIRDTTEFLFADSIAALEQSDDDVTVTFASGHRRSFSLLLGCDGTHSSVRRLCFGDESAFSLFLQNYFSLTIVDKLLLPENTGQIMNLPGKTIMLNAYNGKTDIAFCFAADAEMPYDRRDTDQQKRTIAEQFRGEGWRVPELLGEMMRSDNFYFDKLCQIRMSPWSIGRVALVGDAGYCPSPAAGMGGSMAILGAAALGDALAAHPSDLRKALHAYEQTLRPIADAIQTDAVEVGLKLFAPRTEEALRERNAHLLAG